MHSQSGIKTMVIIFSMIVFLMGCGQKGPLFMPDKAPENKITEDKASSKQIMTEDNGERSQLRQ